MFKIKTNKFLKKSLKSFKIHHIMIIILIVYLMIFIYGLIKTYEGFNTDYPQSRYKPSTTTAIPTALDGTPYISPDKSGSCPTDFERDESNVNSLCHAECKKGKFYHTDNKVYGCVSLNTDYPQSNYSKENYPFAKDTKTNIVSPTIDAKCPKYFDLDLNSGLCYNKCKDDLKFYGEIGCVKLNTTYSQNTYNGDSTPYPIAADNETKYVSPTSNAICPDKFSLDYSSGLCHTACPSDKKFNGSNSGTTIVGCV